MIAHGEPDFRCLYAVQTPSILHHDAYSSRNCRNALGYIGEHAEYLQVFKANLVYSVALQQNRLLRTLTESQNCSQRRIIRRFSKSRSLSRKQTGHCSILIQIKM